MNNTNEINQAITEINESLLKLISILPQTIIAITIFAIIIIILIKLRTDMTEIEKERELEELKPILDYHAQQVVNNIKNIETDEDTSKKRFTQSKNNTCN